MLYGEFKIIISDSLCEVSATYLLHGGQLPSSTTKSYTQLAILKLLWVDSVMAQNAYSKLIKSYIVKSYNSFSTSTTGGATFLDHDIVKD